MGEALSERVYTVRTVNSCIKYLGSLGSLGTRLPHGFLMDAWMISQLNIALIRKPRGRLTRLAYLLSMDVCTTRHWQTSCRVVEESNICTVKRDTQAIRT